MGKEGTIERKLFFEHPRNQFDEPSFRKPHTCALMPRSA
jgi:hypothetical protein